MSQLRKENITCPHCHQEGVLSFWSSVNVDLNPELREKIFSDELFMYHCPHCGEVTGIPAGFLYHDMKHQFMLFTSTSPTITTMNLWNCQKAASAWLAITPSVVCSV